MPARRELNFKKVRFTRLSMQDEGVLPPTEVKPVASTKTGTSIHMPLVPVPALENWAKNADIDQKTKDGFLEMIQNHVVGDARGRTGNVDHVTERAGSTLSEKLSAVSRLIPPSFSKDFNADDQLITIEDPLGLGQQQKCCDCTWYEKLKQRTKNTVITSIDTFNPDIDVNLVNLKLTAFVGIRFIGIFYHVLLLICCIIRAASLVISLCVFCCFRSLLDADDEVLAAYDCLKIALYAFINVVRCINLGFFAAFGLIFSGFPIGCMRICASFFEKDLHDPDVKKVAVKYLFRTSNILAAVLWITIAAVFISNGQQDYLQHLVLLQLFVVIVLFCTELRIELPSKQSDAWRFEARFMVCCLVGIFASISLAISVIERQNKDQCECPDHSGHLEAYTLWTYSLFGGFSSFLL